MCLQIMRNKLCVNILLLPLKNLVVANNVMFAALFVPIGLNYLISKDERNYFEVGAGVTIVSITERYNNESDNFSTTFGHAYFGYCLQPKNGGFIFRAGITPIFRGNFFFPYWAGISLGYKF